jgi:hypothetical protein
VDQLSQITLIVDDDKYSCEGTLQVTQLTRNRFRLDETPFMMFEGGLHDIIEATRQENGTYLFRGVLEKSKWKMHHFILEGNIAESDVFKTTLNKTVEELGGVCEIFWGGCVFVYLPSECDFDFMNETTRIIENLNRPIS